MQEEEKKEGKTNKKVVSIISNVIIINVFYFIFLFWLFVFLLFLKKTHARNFKSSSGLFVKSSRCQRRKRKTTK